MFEFRSRDNIPIKKSDRYKITETKNAIQLALDNVKREEAGQYTLHARTKNNKIGRKDVELVVEDRSSGDDPPTFVRRLNDLSVKVGTRTRLLVEIRSSSNVKVRYKKWNNNQNLLIAVLFPSAGHLVPQ